MKKNYLFVFAYLYSLLEMQKPFFAYSFTTSDFLGPIILYGSIN